MWSWEIHENVDVSGSIGDRQHDPTTQGIISTWTWEHQENVGASVGYECKQEEKPRTK
jgi:hypothetical protein